MPKGTQQERTKTVEKHLNALYFHTIPPKANRRTSQPAQIGGNSTWPTEKKPSQPVLGNSRIHYMHCSNSILPFSSLNQQTHTRTQQHHKCPLFVAHRTDACRFLPCVERNQMRPKNASKRTTTLSMHSSHSECSVVRRRRIFVCVCALHSFSDAS